ncbi:MAG: hypothetical protein HYZ65_12640 [Burkholderiales bacterium]|nr:hypothetical protein [Burkholderiales bacterium]
MAMTAVTALFGLSCGTAQADGLNDLKMALTRLQGQAPLKAVLEAKTWSRQGEGKELEEEQGHASIVLEDSKQGLHVLYSREMLGKLETEERAREKDAKSKSPTVAAAKEFNTAELRNMISAAASLARSMDKAVFKSEKADSYNGKPARLLNFELTIDKLGEKERKYVKKFEGNLDVWIAADGTPLASRRHHNVSWRAFMVVSGENSNDDEQVYAQVGDRLVVTRKENKNSGSGAGEKGESKVVKTLQLQS